MIFKENKDQRFSQNYRFISLLSTVSKMVERVFKITLDENVEEKRFHPSCQFAFRKCLDTEM